MTLTAALNELQAIAQRADKQRLSVWYDQFVTEYPVLAADIEHCATLPPADVLDYLQRKDARFALLRFVPDIQRHIEFLQSWLKTRKDSNDTRS